MVASDEFNLRVHVYGTQGSGSIFPSRAERLAFQRRADVELLTLVLQDLAGRTDETGRVTFRLEDLLGGPIGPKTVARYAQRFEAKEPRVYGGWTTCLRIETRDGHDLVFDCGSGFRNCARDLQAKWADSRERHLYLFGSHSHLDHTEGFDQAAVCFDPRNHLHIYGNSQFLRALDFNLGIFSRQVAPEVQGVQTPIFFGVMPARFHATAIGAEPDAASDDGDRKTFACATRPVESPIQIGGTTITPFEVFHPAPCLAYRIEHGGRIVVFCTDHELRHGDPSHPDQRTSEEAEARVVRYATGADLLYRDGQYLRAEYDGTMGIGGSGAIPRVGWGHSCIEDVVDMATACQVRHTLIGHHDPNRDWSERNWMDESMARRTADSPYRVELARAETVFEL
jgi:ribonuclease BN (tRNA processing enzyme)